MEADKPFPRISLEFSCRENISLKQIFLCIPVLPIIMKSATIMARREHIMTKNMGTLDRIIRTLVAIIIVALLLSGSVTGMLAILFGVFAIAFLGTSAIGWCPLYRPLGISTRKTEQK
jgi:hypothetical protein